MTSQFKTNGSAFSPASASAVARAIAPQVRASSRQIQAAISDLAVGGTATFQTKSVYDSGGKTAIFVERVA